METPKEKQTHHMDSRSSDKTLCQSSTSPSSQRSRASSRSSSEKCLHQHQTVIIFDWDDTLLYSSFIREKHGQHVSSEIKGHLRHVEHCAYKLLEMSLQLGHTYIITNAERGWVEESAALFLPSLMPLLQRVRVISARTTHEAHCEGDVNEWKARAFLDVGREIGTQNIHNLVTVGDSNFEYQATKRLAKHCPYCLIKTVKLHENPSPAELSKELDFLVPKFQSIVEKTANFRAKLEKRMLSCERDSKSDS